MSKSTSLTGRCAVVTGAGRGFGERIAIELATLGAAVCALDVDAEAGDRTVTRIASAGGRATAVVCDISDRREVVQGFEQIRSELGDVDILVNNAGVVSLTDFLELSEDVLASHVKSVFTTCRLLVPGMIERGDGRIVNVASVAGKRGGGFLGKTAYAGAKAAVNGLTKALAREVAPLGVRVNAVNPGLTDTRRLDALRADPEVWARCLAAVPLGRVADPAEIAGAIVYLLSDASAYVTGETLNVDGGVAME